MWEIVIFICVAIMFLHLFFCALETRWGMRRRDLIQIFNSLQIPQARPLPELPEIDEIVI